MSRRRSPTTESDLRSDRSDRSPHILSGICRQIYAFGFALLIAAMTSLALSGCGTDQADAEFKGTVLKSTEPSPPFSLTNQTGQTVTLESLHGRVVVLTFLYTHCPDVCPIVTSQLRDTQEQLSDTEGAVEFVAISVDPERDTVEAAWEYLDRWKLADQWQYLVGDSSVLEPIWESYFVDPYAEETRAVASTPEPRGAVDALGAAIAERYLVIHSAPVFLIDRDGRRRVVFTSPLEPSDIAQDIRTLLK